MNHYINAELVKFKETEGTNIINLEFVGSEVWDIENPTYQFIKEAYEDCGQNLYINREMGLAIRFKTIP